MDYRVDLDVYHGPMDLLLYLIKRDELEITDIPIARITNSYMQYLEMLRKMGGRDGLDINLAGDFIVMAATLMEIKSAMLLPRDVPAEGDSALSAAKELADPRFEMVQKLLEYKRFKDNAQALDQKARLQEQRFVRDPARDDATDEPPPLDLEEVQIWDLLECFNRLMLQIGIRGRLHEVTDDDTPLALHAADIEDRLTREKTLTLEQLMHGRKNRGEMIGVFLALLELIRQKKVLVQQAEALGEICIVSAPEEHRQLREDDTQA